MSVRMRKTKGKRNSRRANHNTITVAPHNEKKEETGAIEIHPRHRASRETGTYRDRTVIDVSRKIERMERKRDEKGTAKQDDNENRTVEQAEIPNA